jgi:hypothetical protein
MSAYDIGEPSSFSRDLLRREKARERRKSVVIDFALIRRHRLHIGKHGKLLVVEQIAVFPVLHLVELFPGETGFEPHRNVLVQLVIAAEDLCRADDGKLAECPRRRRLVTQRRCHDPPGLEHLRRVTEGEMQVDHLPAAAPRFGEQLAQQRIVRWIGERRQARYLSA